jgi:hypothetical protein
MVGEPSSKQITWCDIVSYKRLHDTNFKFMGRTDLMVGESGFLACLGTRRIMSIVERKRQRCGEETSIKIHFKRSRTFLAKVSDSCDNTKRYVIEGGL